FYDQSNDPIISKAGGQNYAYAIGVNSLGQVWLRFSDAGNDNLLFTPANAAPLNAWTQVTAVVDGTAKNMAIYIDGVLSASKSFTAYAPIDAATPLMIAADQPLGAFGDGAFQGLIQQVALWNIALDATTIGNNFDQAPTGQEAGLVVYLP